ncbi:flavocytochrome c [Campylobacter blaseri]|uniref:Flavocytochrome c n=1 Tax=Campylobacter blaseri TaxID=2042961 RepID=A0A2P8R192_9BACT|nr:flavocytochrome c [Campylobacter blaseri]PSM52266.1 flavocytochrome c [Campylobacter blaseri]PSM54032.1 flavocytochrome c [Campylobacter blaseri]QKF85473.1 flavocytochrome c [Campylobacter blaseri]
MANMSRRDMLKMSMIGAGTLALSSVNANAKEAKDVKFDEEWDVVVVGSGFAGLSAGVTAAKKGNKVLIIEKMGRVGGNSVINGGVFGVWGNDFQEKEGIKDSKELYIKDILKAGGGLNHPELVETLADRVRDAYQLTKDCGAKYIMLKLHGGHSVPRGALAESDSGAGIIRPMSKFFQDIDGCELRRKCKLDHIITDESGKVIGVEVRDEYQFDKDAQNDDKENTSGTTKFIKAKKGVVLASGGFSRDKHFRKAQDPRIADDLDSTNHPGATAGVLLEALKVGAEPVQVSWIQSLPLSSPDEKGYGVSSAFTHESFRFGIIVSPKTGKRYGNELANRKIQADYEFKSKNEDGVYLLSMCDSKAAAEMLPEKLEKVQKVGIVKKFDSLEDIAKEYNMPLDEFKKTVANYNQYVKDEKDPEFGKNLSKDITKGYDFSVAPFYVSRVIPKVHHTMGGVNITPKAEVISADTNKPIPGLYAAGEITGGVHGAVRLGSMAIADCLTFGMIAGENF